MLVPLIRSVAERGVSESPQGDVAEIRVAKDEVLPRSPPECGSKATSPGIGCELPELPVDVHRREGVQEQNQTTSVHAGSLEGVSLFRSWSRNSGCIELFRAQ